MLIAIKKRIVCVATFNKRFAGQTWVMGGHANVGKVLSKLPKKWRSPLSVSGITPEKSIMLDDAAFNRQFSVFTDDEVEARYILTHTLMEKMVAFNQLFPFMSYEFAHNKILFHARCDLIATETVSQQFNIEKISYYELFDYTLDEDIATQTEKHHALIHNVVEIIKLLELNQIIWK